MAVAAARPRGAGTSRLHDASSTTPLRGARTLHVRRVTTPLCGADTLLSSRVITPLRINRQFHHPKGFNPISSILEFNFEF
ncbi:uncharacterized protein DS421_5g157810 [Arachis hypogaea]|nr:uncharacterized protein DS421_5g157810 [Arachis hypogaea]